MKNFIYNIDYNVAKLFHDIYLWGGDLFNFIMKGISWIAEAGLIFILIGLCLALFKKTRKIGITALFAVAVGFICTNIVLKNLIERSRPFANVSSNYYKWWLDAGSTYESGYSFPSGHTTATTAFAIAIFLTTNKKYSWYVLLAPILMASSRIYLMVHFFSDCVGGIVVGLISAVIAFLIVKWIYSSKIKLFVWARELNIFKFEKKTQITLANNSPKTLENPIEEIYITQEEEKSIKKDTNLIKQATEKSKTNNSNNTNKDIDNK